MSRRLVVSAAGVAIAASVLVAGQAGAASSLTTARTYVLKASLDSRHEVRRPRDARDARGSFSAKLVLNGKKSSLVWTLRFSHLSSRLTAAHLHFGAPGKAGVVALPLCVRCKSPAHGAYNGPYVANPQFVKAVLHGSMYVNVHTKKNPKGEIRGQIKATAA